MAKIHKTYEAFVVNKNFKFEPEVIDPILIIIRDNQDYLTQPENIPQLGKLGYMYNTLWYAGRVCWGYDGILRKGAKLKVRDDDGEEYNYGDCEDNPKYKIEMCNPHDERIENLIYDAWGMHVSNDMDFPIFEEFKKLILNGKQLTEFQKNERKPNKTFDEWVDIMTDSRYQYHSMFKDRRAVANYLLCVIGTGYGFNKDGFVIKEAGGADQDEDMYGEWENAKFLPEIQSVVEKILNIPEVEQTLDSFYEYKQGLVAKKKSEERKKNKSFYDTLKKFGLYKDEEGDLEWDELHGRLGKAFTEMEKKSGKSIFKKEEEKKYHAYYPISSSSIIHTICDKESRQREGITHVDPSYVEASKEICFDILAHEEEESKERKGNIKHAKNFLAQLGVEGFELPKTYDKYQLLKDIKEYLSYITDELPELQIGQFNQSMKGKDGYFIYFKDTARDKYGDNNYHAYINYSPEKSAKFPKGRSNDVEFLKSSSYYEEIMAALDRIKAREEVKLVQFYFTNIGSASIEIIIHTNTNTSNYAKDKIKSEEDFKKNGFTLDVNMLELQLDKIGIVLSEMKPEPLGTTHPNNKTGKEYFSQNKQMQVFDKNGRNITTFNIDERGFNIITNNHMPADPEKKKLVKWIFDEYACMKATDKAYGTYNHETRKGEGKKNLYIHDFMLWLKNNQDNFK